MEEVNRLIAEHNGRYGDDPIPSLYWHVSGFEHPALPVITQTDGAYRMDMML